MQTLECSLITVSLPAIFDTCLTGIQKLYIHVVGDGLALVIGSLLDNGKMHALFHSTSLLNSGDS